MDAAWLQEQCALPVEDVKLAALAGCDLKTWLKVKDSILPCFDIGEDGLLRNPRLHFEWLRSHEMRARRRNGAQKTNEQRDAQRTLSARSAQPERTAQRTAQRTPTATATSPSTATETTDYEPAPADAAADAPESGGSLVTSTAPLTGKGKGRPTWLTPYGDAWRDRWGQESEPPWGELGQSLKRPMRELDHDDLEARWGRFLAAAERSEWARPARFVQGLGQWAEQPGGSGPAKRMSAKAQAHEDGILIGIKAGWRAGK